MNNTKEQISSAVLMFAIACFVQSSTLLVGFITGITKQDTWFAVLLGFIVALPLVWMFAKLGEEFPGKNLIEINDIVFGKIIGKIISVLYIFFFFSLNFLNTSVMCDFVNGSLLPETPRVAILIMFVGVCAFAVRKGLECMTRYSALFVVIVCAVVIINTILLLKDINFKNFQPALALPLKSYIQGVHEVAILPFGDILVFLMLFSNLKNPQKIKKPLFGGLIIGGITLLFITSRDTAVLGPMISYMGIPAFDVVRLINLADTLTRMEIFYALILLILLFFKTTILFYAVVKAIAQIFNIKSYKLLVPVVGALIVSFAINPYDSSMANAYNAAYIAPIFQSLFEIVLPAITLVIAAIRGLHKSEAVSQ